jgi:hypothetical protein
MNGLRPGKPILMPRAEGPVVYLDQRENYLAARTARARARSRLLYLNRWICVASGLASGEVEAVDSSAGALALGEANAKANGIENVSSGKRMCSSFWRGSIADTRW